MHIYIYMVFLHIGMDIYIYTYIYIFVPNGCPNVFDIPIYIFMVPAPIAILSNLITLHEHV